MRPAHDRLVESAAAFGEIEDSTLETLRDAAPSEPLGSDGFFEYLFEATETAGLGTTFEAIETACADLEFTAYQLGATEPTCLIE